jgi:CMP-N,N'-diacetyllegionaminic acid synthase
MPERKLKVFALIPARGGSKGVPKKNIKPLAAYPLIAYSIAAAKLCPVIDRIVVSTDSEEIANISKKYGADVPFTRPPALASDKSPDREFIMHALEYFDREEGELPDYLVHLRPTTPLRDPTLVNEAIEAIQNNPEATSLRSAHPAPESPFKWFTRDDGGYFHGLNPGGTPGYSNLPRQSFAAVYIPDGYVDVLRVSFLLKSTDIHGDRIMGYISPVCVEVDTAREFEFLEFEISKSANPLAMYLKSNYPAEV